MFPPEEVELRVTELRDDSIWQLCRRPGRRLDYEQSLFFLSPSNKTRENAHARDWKARDLKGTRLAVSPLDAFLRAWLTEEKRETARSLEEDWNNLLKPSC